MKKFLLFLLLSPALVYADGYQLPKYDIFSLESTDKNNVFRVQENFKDLYSKLNLMVKTYGNQSIDGNKTFTKPLVAQSSMTVYGRIIGGGLKILQTVQATSAGTFNTQSVSYVDTALTATITPKYSSSLVFVVASGQIYNTNATVNMKATISRNGTSLGGATGFAGTNLVQYVPITMTYLDSPASTSALTYTVQIKSGDGSVAAHWNNLLTTSVITLFEIGE